MQKADGPFDLVVAVCVFHELFGDCANAGSESAFRASIEDTPVWDPSGKGAIAGVRQLLAANGRFVAANRWGHPERSLQWVRLTEAVGLQIDLARSYMLEARSEINGKESLPLTVHRGAEAVQPATADDILALHSYPKFRDDAEHFALEGVEAETMYRGLGPKELLAGFDATYIDGSGVERQEIFVAGPIVALYISSSRGYRRLGIGSLAFLPEMVRAMRSTASERLGVASVSALSPGTIDPRWKLYGISAADVRVHASDDVPAALRRV